MRGRTFGPTGRDVAVIGQGTWNIESDKRAAIAALQSGIALGMTHIDTAEMYGSGRAEEIVGEAIAGRREQIFLVSKVLPQNASRAGAVKACEQSLARLKTDRLDCYLLHWPGRHALEDTIGAFETLQRAGKIRSWGLSNFDVDGLDEALAIAGRDKIACNQVLYHLEERAIEHAVMPWCKKHNVAVVAYSPFGSGSFPVAKMPGGKVLQTIAEAHDATPRQVALAFLLRDQSVLAIPKATTPAHVGDNANAGDLELTADEIARISTAFPLGKKRALPTI